MFEESDERVVIVSPYIKISNWIRLVKKLRELIDRNVQLEIYVRDDPTNKSTYRDLDHLELKYVKLPHLHAKLYMNEKCGIDTSMNLLLSSELNTLEMAYSTETWKEYDELQAYYFKFVQQGRPCLTSTADGLPVDMNEFQDRICGELKDSPQNIWPWLDGKVLHITTGRNNFQVTLGGGWLIITADLEYRLRSVKDDKKASKMLVKMIGDLSKMKIDLQSIDHPGNIRLTARAHKNLVSPAFMGMLKSEEDYILGSICRLVEVTGNLEV